MSERSTLLVVHDEADAVRQINSDGGAVLAAAAQDARARLSVPNLLNVSRPQQLREALHRDDLIAVVFGSNSLRHTDSVAAAAAAEQSRLAELVADGVGMLSLHQYGAPRLPFLTDATRGFSPSHVGRTSRLVESGDGIGWLPHGVVCEGSSFVDTTTWTIQFGDDLAWTAVDASSGCRPLISTESGTALVGQLEGQDVVLCAIPLDWWSASKLLCNLIVRVAGGRLEGVSFDGVARRQWLQLDETALDAIVAHENIVDQLPQRVWAPRIDTNAATTPQDSSDPCMDDAPSAANALVARGVLVHVADETRSCVETRLPTPDVHLARAQIEDVLGNWAMAGTVLREPTANIWPAASLVDGLVAALSVLSNNRLQQLLGSTTLGRNVLRAAGRPTTSHAPITLGDLTFSRMTPGSAVAAATLLRTLDAEADLRDLPALLHSGSRSAEAGTELEVAVRAAFSPGRSSANVAPLVELAAQDPIVWRRVRLLELIALASPPDGRPQVTKLVRELPEDPTVVAEGRLLIADVSQSLDRGSEKVVERLHAVHGELATTPMSFFERCAARGLLLRAHADAASSAGFRLPSSATFVSPIDASDAQASAEMINRLMVERDQLEGGRDWVRRRHRAAQMGLALCWLLPVLIAFAIQGVTVKLPIPGVVSSLLAAGPDWLTWALFVAVVIGWVELLAWMGALPAWLGPARKWLRERVQR